jgi:transposase
VDHANALRHAKPVCKVVRQSRWLLLRNQENLKAAQAVALKKLWQPISRWQPFASH